jgi:signal transduction histidine kinase
MAAQTPRTAASSAVCASELVAGSRVWGCVRMSQDEAEMVRGGAGADSRFPIGFLTVAVLVTVVALGWATWEISRGYLTTRRVAERNAQIEDLRGIIVHLDEVLTMSARMAVATGDHKWVDRYHEYEPRLDAAIKKAREIAPEAYHGEGAAQTDAANIKLVEMEKRAFALIADNRMEEARELLFSEDYETEKRVYAQGMTRFTVTPQLDLRLEQLRGIIVHLDEVLTMSARMAVETGGQKWVDRYREYEPLLDAAIKEAESLAPAALVRDAAAQTNAANVKLVAMENQAFMLIDDGQIKEAQRLLASPEYERQKAIYAEGMQQFAGRLKTIANDKLQNVKSLTLLAGAATISALVVLMIGWAFVLRTARRWHVALVQNNRDLSGQARQLAELNRTLEVEHARLRVADRLASIGTLTAGLGHDMSNVLLPIRCRLDALDWDTVPPDLREFINATHSAVDYLTQLCDGLRSLAVDRQQKEGWDEETSLADWWNEIKPLMRALLPGNVELESDIPKDLSPVNIAPQRLSQAVLNLTANAGEAMPKGGRMRIWATAVEGESFVRIGITDEGVGMTEEVRLRVLDPFFTTKTRSLSTGLGLWSAHGVVTSAGGSMEIDSAPGKGTTVVLTLPTADEGSSVETARNDLRSSAMVSLQDQHMAAWIMTVLNSAGYSVCQNELGDPDGQRLWVTDPTAENLRIARRFSSDVNRRVVVLGPAEPEWAELGAVVVEETQNLEAIRAAVRAVTPEPSAPE